MYRLDNEDDKPYGGDVQKAKDDYLADKDDEKPLADSTNSCTMPPTIIELYFTMLGSAAGFGGVASVLAQSARVVERTTQDEHRGDRPAVGSGMLIHRAEGSSR